MQIKVCFTNAQAIFGLNVPMLCSSHRKSRSWLGSWKTHLNNRFRLTNFLKTSDKKRPCTARHNFTLEDDRVCGGTVCPPLPGGSRPTVDLIVRWNPWRWGGPERVSVPNARLIHTGPLINAALCWPLMKGQECPPQNKAMCWLLCKWWRKRRRGKSALDVYG